MRVHGIPPTKGPEATLPADPVESGVDSLRTRAAADAAIRQLLLHLGATKIAIADVAGLPAKWRTLSRYGRDMILNIRWYDRELIKQRRLRAGLTALTVVIGLVLVSAPFWGGELIKKIYHDSPPLTPTVLSAHVGVVLTTALAAWRLILSVTDKSTRIGIFWEASADLKALHFSLVDRWKDLLAGGIPDQLIADVEERLQQSRPIVRTERTAFFATFSSPTAVVDKVSAELELVTKSRNTLLEALKTEAANTKTEAATAKAEAAAHVKDEASWTVDEATRAHNLAVLEQTIREQTLEALKKKVGEKDPVLVTATNDLSAAMIAATRREILLEQAKARQATTGGAEH